MTRSRGRCAPVEVSWAERCEPKNPLRLKGSRGGSRSPCENRSRRSPPCRVSPCQKGTSVLPVVAALKAHPDREKLCAASPLESTSATTWLVSGWYPERDLLRAARGPREDNRSGRPPAETCGSFFRQVQRAARPRGPRRRRKRLDRQDGRVPKLRHEHRGRSRAVLQARDQAVGPVPRHRDHAALRRTSQDEQRDHAARGVQDSPRRLRAPPGLLHRGVRAPRRHRKSRPT